jgi:macrolide-specific efflux system membrane fusion protein
MTADASIVVAQKSDVLRLPRAVVRARSGTTARVKIWADGRVEDRTVEVGLRGDVSIEVVEGLSERERVVAE